MLDWTLARRVELISNGVASEPISYAGDLFAGSEATRPARGREPPEPYRRNLDVQAPLDERPRGSAPAMSDQDIDDLLAFLSTLTDADLAGDSNTSH